MAGKLHSLDELEKVIGGKEQLGYSPGEVRRAYDESISVVEYLVEKHGIEKFWAYATDYAESRSLPESTQKVLGVSYVQLNQDWQSWVQKKYGRG
ncbi:MAG: hypothetical protein HY329_16085 [Chloroflexi bacterium]|nr:hypothetical protein [Chloroflexota bacterium]